MHLKNLSYNKCNIDLR